MSMRQGEANREVARGQEPKRLRGRLRVAAILQTSVELFSQKGFGAATMTEIAARSGTAIASLYRFFPTKEAVAEALLQAYADHALAGLAALSARAKGLSPAELAAGFVEFRVCDAGGAPARRRPRRGRRRQRPAQAEFSRSDAQELGGYCPAMQP